MAYGIRIRNSASGSIQIDHTRPNLALLATGTVVSAAGSGIFGYTATFDVAATGTLLFAIRSNAFATIAHVEGVSGGQRVHIYTEAAGQSVTVYAFGAPSYQGPGYALVVRNPETEDITFDSRMKYARVAGFFAGDYDVDPLTYTLPSGRTYAAMPVKKSGYHDSWGVHVPAGSDPPFEHYQLHAHRSYSGVRFNSGNQVQLGIGIEIFSGFLGLISAVGYPTLHQERSDFAWLLLDVTGY